MSSPACEPVATRSKTGTACQAIMAQGQMVELDALP